MVNPNERSRASQVALDGQTQTSVSRALDSGTPVKILCVIPARSGSKGIPDKNIRLFRGKPLIAHSILQARASKYQSSLRVIVSTDSERYAEIAREFGAECPFLRPSEISQDFSTDLECVQQCLDFLKMDSGYVPDCVLHLRPTQPLRSDDDVDACLDTFLRVRGEYDSLRTVTRSKKSPFKMYTISGDEPHSNGLLLKPLFETLEGITEPFNVARQALPVAYLHNGYIDIVNVDVIARGEMSGKRIYPFVMGDEKTIDIDTEDDWTYAEQRALAFV